MLDIIKSKIFPENVTAGIATGYNGKQVSYSFFNTNSNLYNVEYSRKELELYFSDYFDSFFYQKQIHSDIVLDIDSINPQDKLESDAVITNNPGFLLNISVADCQAVLIYDKINKIVAAVHSGWKGTHLKITEKTINKLISDYGSNPKNLLLFLPPSASAENYVVGEEFLDYFPNSIIKRNDIFYFDNKNEIINQLLNCGCLKENIESINECTIANKGYHSYRRDKNESGRMSAFIGIKS